MSIQIITKDERLTGTVCGVLFTYRRATQAAVQEIRDNNTSKGETDESNVGRDLMALCVLDWDGKMTDGNGKPLPFDVKWIPEIPMKAVMALGELISSNVDGKHDKVDPT